MYVDWMTDPVVLVGKLVHQCKVSYSECQRKEERSVHSHRRSNEFLIGGLKLRLIKIKLIKIT